MATETLEKSKPAPADAAAAAGATGKTSERRSVGASERRNASRSQAAAAPTAAHDLSTALEAATKAQLEEGITVELETAPVQTRPAEEIDPDIADPDPDEAAAHEPAAEAASTEETESEDEAALTTEESGDRSQESEEDAAPAEEFEAETADELEHEATAKGWPKSASKRLGKLLAQKAALKAQLEGAEALRAERDALKAKLEAHTESPDGPAAGPAPVTVTAFERQLESEIALKEQWLETIDANPDGLTLKDPQGRETVYSPEALRKAKSRFERDLAKTEIRLESHRATLTQQTAAYSQAAREAHPFLKDKSSPEYQMVQQVLKAFPEVARIPDHLSVLGDALAYRRLMAAKGKASGARGQESTATPPVKKPAPAVRQAGRPGTAPARVSGEALANTQKRQNFLKTGDSDDGKATILDLVEARA